MRAGVIAEVGRVRVEEVPIPPLGHGQILVRVRECGICGSDVKMYLGHHPILRPPLRPGHEVYGEVADSSGSLHFKNGDVVAIFPPIGCGSCENCRRGMYNVCRDMKFIGGQVPGGLSEYLVVPQANLVPIPEEVPEEVRVLVEPTAVAVHAAARSRLAGMGPALVVGQGPIGVLVALVLKAGGTSDVVVVDTSPTRVRLSAELGLEAYEVAQGELPELVHRRFGADGVDVAFDCSGHPGALADAFASLRRGGELILVGMQGGLLSFDGVELQRGERAVVGVQMYTHEDFLRAITLLKSGAVPSKLVTMRMPLAELPRAFSLAHEAQGVLKVVVSVGSQE